MHIGYRFYKTYRYDALRWYIDLPDYIEEGHGTIDDCEMVDGADVFLDILSNHDDEIFLIISDEEFEGCSVLYKESDEQECIGNYLFTSVDRKIGMSTIRVWLCKVLLYVFNQGTYPDKIYFKKS